MAGPGHNNGDTTSSSHHRRAALFPVGSSVEVKTNEEGFKNVYFSATVVPSSRKSSKRIHVEYTHLLAHESGSDPLREYVKVEFLRPVPPSEDIVRGFEAGDVVDASYQDGWWVGMVDRVAEGSNKYIVSFEEPADQLEFDLDDIRPHWDWVLGRWVRPLNKSRNEIDVGRKVEVSFEGEDAWFPATVQECLGNGDILVEYSNSKSEAERANVDSLHVRPCPPLVRGKKELMLLGKVEAFFDFGWRSGVITYELEDSRYLVFFRQMNVDKEFDESELRALMEWNNGEWVLSTADGMHESMNGNSSPAATSTRSLTTKRRLYLSDRGAALKKQQVGNVEGVVVPSLVGRMKTTSVGSEAKYSKMPKGFRSKRVARNVKRTLTTRVGQEEVDGLVEESPSSGQDTSRKIAFEVEENSVVGEMMAVENVIDEVAKNQVEEGRQEPTCLEEVNPASTQEEERKTAVEVEDLVASEKEVCEVPIEIGVESFSKYIDEMDTVTAFDSSRLPPLKQCSVHNNWPFEKTAVLWQTIESIEALQRFPQNPHFQPLEQENIGLREGLAIGHMVNFSNLVKQTSKLQVSDPKSSMDEIMAALPVLETHGFDVSVVRERVSELLIVKDGEEKLLDEANNLKDQILVQRREKDGIVEESREIQEEIRKLEEKLLLLESAKAKLDEEISSLQAGVEETERKMKNGRAGLKVML